VLKLFGGRLLFSARFAPALRGHLFSTRLRSTAPMYANVPSAGAFAALLCRAQLAPNAPTPLEVLVQALSSPAQAAAGRAILGRRGRPAIRHRSSTGKHDWGAAYQRLSPPVRRAGSVATARPRSHGSPRPRPDQETISNRELRITVTGLLSP